MKLIMKHFDDLTNRELYKIMQARVAVFVVEQNCPYQEIDGKDYESYHMFYEDNGKIAAYLRFFPLEDNIVQLARVLTIQRGIGLGGKILHEGVEEIHRRFHPRKIVLEAQCYATGFYAKEGFQICSEQFLEDDIPHVWMELELSN